jgi:hypothetical protein
MTAEPKKRGRKPLYATPEEKAAAIAKRDKATRRLRASMEARKPIADDREAIPRRLLSLAAEMAEACARQAGRAHRPPPGGRG